jgi:Tfp pilus assembly protein PilX
LSRRRRPFSRRLAEARGGALVLALMVLVGLTVTTLALLSIGALEPQISRNHLDVVRARYLAEAGIEHAYDTLAVNAGAWSGYLTGATCTTGTLLADATLPERPRAHGHFVVLLRNDCAPGDERLTGVPTDDAMDPTRDGNGKVVASSTGVVARAHHTVTAVISDDRISRDPSQSVSRNAVRTYNWSDH